MPWAGDLERMIPSTTSPMRGPCVNTTPLHDCAFDHSHIYVLRAEYYMLQIHVKIDKAKGCDPGSMGFAISIVGYLETLKHINQACGQ